jgi:hypothetical protein
MFARKDEKTRVFSVLRREEADVVVVVCCMLCVIVVADLKGEDVMR